MTRLAAIHQLVCAWLNEDERNDDLLPHERDASFRRLRECLLALGVRSDEFDKAHAYREGRVDVLGEDADA